MKKKVISSKWYSTLEKWPDEGDNILCYYWYDGPHYFRGIYNSKTSEVEDDTGASIRKLSMEHVDFWMLIPELDYSNFLNF